MESDAEILDRTITGNHNHAKGVTRQKITLCTLMRGEGGGGSLFRAFVLQIYVDSGRCFGGSVIETEQQRGVMWS